MRPFAFLLIATALTLASPHALAQGDSAAADKLFQEARALMKRGDHAGACPKLAESQRLDPSEGTLFFLAECHEKTGKLVEALEALEELRERLPPTHQNAGLVKERIAALDKRVPRLTIRLNTALSGIRVVLNGKKIEVGETLNVNPGSHNVIVSAAGHADRAFGIELREGEASEIEVAPGATLSRETEGNGSRIRAAPVAVGDSSAATPEGKTFGFVLGGLGVLGLGVGAASGLVANSKEQENHDHCHDAPYLGRTWSYCDTQDGRNAANTAKTFATVSTVAFVVGGVALAGAGAYFVVTSRGDERRTALTATVGDGAGRINLQGTF